MNYLHPNDLIVYKTGDNQHRSAGYGIESLLFNNGFTPLSEHFRQHKEEEEEDPEYHNNLAVPLGLYVKPYESRPDEHCDKECHGPIPEEIHNTFIALVELPAIKQTRHKKKERKSSTTKKNNKPKNRIK